MKKKRKCSEKYKIALHKERRDNIMSNYVPYHVHTDYSLLDSCTSYKDYIDACVQYGMSAISFTEHG